MLAVLTGANVFGHTVPNSTLIYVAGALVLGAPIQRGAEAFFTAVAVQRQSRYEDDPPPPPPPRKV